MQTFDRFAEHYDDWFKTGLGKYVLHYEKELVLKLAMPKPGEKILDIGIGTGVFAVELMKYKTEITGIDVSERMLEIARSKGLTNVAVGDAVSLDFPDETFDLVISITALEFIKEYEKAISEMVRVCKKGGRVVVGTLGSGSLWALKRNRAARKDAGSVFRHARFYSFGELKRLAETFGYKSVVKGAVFALPFDNAFCVSTGRWIEKICQSLFPSRGAFLAFRIEKT
jgi:ubiquinone/menaquinone biosynthesis C-methylase UbiE